MSVKKTAANKTSDVKTNTPKKNGAKKSGDFSKAYVRFRTILDGFELTAMRYFLKDKNEAERIKRAEELEKLMMPIIRKYQNQILEGNPGECPEGFFNCEGCCLAYPCPE